MESKIANSAAGALLVLLQRGLGMFVPGARAGAIWRRLVPLLCGALRVLKA